MKRIKIFLFLFFITSFLVMQFFLINSLKKLYSFEKFFSMVEKIEKIINFTYSLDDSFANLSKNSNCAIFKLPSINEKNFLLKDFFDYVVILYHKNIVFFNLQPSNLSKRTSKSFYIKNIQDFDLKYLNNTLEFTILINEMTYSCDFFIEKYFVKIPFYNEKVF